MTGQFPVQGSKNIIWDVLIVEETKLRPYLDYILDTEIVMQAPRKSVTTVKEKLNKNPIEIANNTIHFLNGLTKDELKEAIIKEKFSIITWERKVVSKHRHLDTMEKKIAIMNQEIELFIESISPLCKKSLPFFWEEKGKMFSQKNIIIVWSNAY